MKTLIAVLLIVHGLITAAFSMGNFKSTPPVANPAWLSGYPFQMGQSWLLSPLGLDRSPLAAVLGGVLYLVGGAALIGAGLGRLGLLIPPSSVPALAITGAGCCLAMLLVYFHPFYLVGIAANVAVMWPGWLLSTDF